MPPPVLALLATGCCIGVAAAEPLLPPLVHVLAHPPNSTCDKHTDQCCHHGCKMTNWPCCHHGRDCCCGGIVALTGCRNDQTPPIHPLPVPVAPSLPPPPPLRSAAPARCCKFRNFTECDLSLGRRCETVPCVENATCPDGRFGLWCSAHEWHTSCAFNWTFGCSCEVGGGGARALSRGMSLPKSDDEAVISCVQIPPEGLMLSKPGQDVTVCPGKYTAAVLTNDSAAITIRGSNIMLRLDGVELMPAAGRRFEGWGVHVEGVSGVKLTGGHISGFRAAVLIKGGSGHEVSGARLSHNRMRRVLGTPADFLSVWPEFEGQLVVDSYAFSYFYTGI